MENLSKLEADLWEAAEYRLPVRGGVRAPLQAAHFQGKAAIFLPEQIQYSYLVNLPEDQDTGAALAEELFQHVYVQYPDAVQNVYA